ncbi:MAG: hypothetical protein JXX29_24155 [Deltaproteobacteria bacterium]|nr:hypothetical protein [Deltaproteobacteria bacterium]MBN2674796.1 hypothetical protein [Deltaproteobacteria bacterium]
MILKISLFPIVFIVFSFIWTACAQLQGSKSCPLGYKRAKAGNCVHDLSCEETEKCKTSGKCTYASEDLCVATRLRDCQLSSNCAKLGECSFRLNGRDQSDIGLCVADVDGCARSEICAEFGKCTPGEDGFCVVGGDVDCAESKVCREQGRCTAKRVQRADGKRSKIMACQQ